MTKSNLLSETRSLLAETERIHRERENAAQRAKAEAAKAHRRAFALAVLAAAEAPVDKAAVHPSLLTTEGERVATPTPAELADALQALGKEPRDIEHYAYVVRRWVELCSDEFDYDVQRAVDRDLTAKEDQKREGLRIVAEAARRAFETCDEETRAARRERGAHVAACMLPGGQFAAERLEQRDAMAEVGIVACGEPRTPSLTSFASADVVITHSNPHAIEAGRGTVVSRPQRPEAESEVEGFGPL